MNCWVMAAAAAVVVVVVALACCVTPMTPCRDRLTAAAYQLW